MITGEITCDKCKRSWPLDLALRHTHVESRNPTLPYRFDTIEKAFNTSAGKEFKKFHVCGDCVDTHHRQADLLFNQHFRDLK